MGETFLNTGIPEPPVMDAVPLLVAAGNVFGMEKIMELAGHAEQSVLGTAGHIELWQLLSSRKGFFGELFDVVFFTEGQFGTENGPPFILL